MKNPKSILITGASSGIGQALAVAYARPGVLLRLTGRDGARLQEVATRCCARGATVDSSTVPVTDAGFAEIVTGWDDAKAIDLVIANAGISGGSGGGEDDAPFRKIMATNLDGTFNTVNPLLPRFIARRRGQVALMSSMAGFRGMPNAPAYSTSKMAVRAYGEALRPLLAKDRVEVCTIFPGFIKTPLTDVNSFPMPFLIDAETAAEFILRGLAANKARIAFPWQMHVLARLVAALPLALGDFILACAPKKN